MSKKIRDPSAQLDKVLSYCDSAAGQARVIRGGRRLERNGYFVEPTIVTETSPDMNFRREEIFGQVLCAVSFENEDLDEIARLTRAA